jgi:glucose-6-phosphate isomerase
MITASRLGSAPLTFDWSSLASIGIGSSLKGGRGFGPDHSEVAGAWERLKGRFATGEVAFYGAPVDESVSQAVASQTLARELLSKNIFTDCLILGIGGSALGPISLLGALPERATTSIRFHFAENPDATEWKTTISKLNPATTLVCAITKSGTTFETVAQLLCAIEWLGRDRLRSHLVAITDPVKGDLRAFATAEGIPTLAISPGVGGRFSIFTPVGLFPAALAGLSVNDFLLGAKQVRDYCEKAPLEKNPLMILAQELLRHEVQRRTHVCMPYSSRLKLLGSWFVQLWGESLGKDGKGFNPIAAVGATDQHSILQLLRDGPDDKVTFFIGIDQVPDEARIPKLSSYAGYPAFKLLEGHTLHELLQASFRATSLVLTKQNRPSLSIQLDRLDERSLGALYFAFAVLTSVTGTLWNVNPFDQPGVEEGKVYIRESLSQPRPASSVLGEDPDDNSPVSRLRRDR